MTIILIVVLFVSQLLSFYCIIILNTKLAKFKDLEIKQERLMREMEDAISVYLAEIKDENDRLINELQMVPKQKTVIVTEPKEKDKEIFKQSSEKDTNNAKDEQPSKEENVPGFEMEPRVIVPKKTAVSAYSRQQQSSINTTKQGSSVVTLTEERLEKQKELTFEEQVVHLSKQGKTVEEIAKQLQKGKTEIELLLKFHC